LSLILGLSPYQTAASPKTVAKVRKSLELGMQNDEFFKEKGRKSGHKASFSPFLFKKY
jgi:hypothetical protein